MRYRNRGQIMPFCLLLITILIWLVYSNFEIGFLQFKKVEQQKKLDAYTLNMATQMARGYNGLAAINEGIDKARFRFTLVSTVVAIASACSPFVPACAKYMTRLGPKLPAFYRKLFKLVDIMTRDQDDIAKWMVRAHCELKTEAQFEFDNFSVYPNYSCLNSDITQLPFYRPAASNPQPETQCKSRTIENFSNFQAEISNYLSNPNFINVSVIATYRNYQTGRIHTENADNRREAQLLPATKTLNENGRYLTYNFIKAEIVHCVKANDIISKFSSKFGAVIPLARPLVLKPEFFTIQNRMIALASGKTKSPFQDQHGDILNSMKEKIWATTETKIIGDDFAKMKFEPRYNPVSMTRELNQSISSADKILFGYPNLARIENDIHH